MNYLKVAMMIGCFAIAGQGFARPMTVYCADELAPNECGNRAYAALSKLGCLIEQKSLGCHYTAKADPSGSGEYVDGDKSYCTLEAANCQQPRVGNFGGETCLEGAKIQVPRSEGIHNGYWFGIWGSYSRTICRAEPK